MRLARILVIGGMGIALGGFLAPAVRADFLHVPASEFTPADGRISYLGGPYVYMSSAAGYMIAPVNLPDRAVVKNIRLFFYDNEPESLELTLIRHNQFNGDHVFMFSIETQGAFDDDRSAVDSTCSPAPCYRKVYNNVCQYYLRAHFRTTGGALGLYGVSIEYD